MTTCEQCHQQHANCPRCGLETHFTIRPRGQVSGWRHVLDPYDDHEALSPGWTGPDIPRVPLASLTDVAKILNLSDARIGQLMVEDVDFPTPVDRPSSGAVWYRAEVEMYRHNRVRRAPGRPRRE